MQYMTWDLYLKLIIMSFVLLSGRRFDADGNFKNWWSPEVDESFKEKAQCFIDQFNGYEMPGVGTVTILSVILHTGCSDSCEIMMGVSGQ